MKRRRMLLIYAALSAMFLTGCNRYGTDMPKEYKDFFDYTFGGNYTVELAEEGVINEGTDQEQGYRYWDITYTDKRGNEHTTRLTGAQLAKERKETYKTQEWFDVFELDAFVSIEMGDIAEQELWDEILSDKLELEYTWGKTIHEGEECTLSMLISGVFYNFDEAGFRYASQNLSPEDGRSIAECDLASILQDEQFMLMLLVTLEPDADTASYQEKIKQIEEELQAYTGGMQNYMIVLRQDDGGETNTSTTLYDHKVFLGEDFVPDPSVEYDSVSKAMLRRWKEKYE